MIGFLFKGILRDRHRSLFPIISVTAGVMLTVLLHCWITGVMGDLIDFNARFQTGHIKVVSEPYSRNMKQLPNDLALVGVSELIHKLENDYPDMEWVMRTRLGGLLDIPDENGETVIQGTVVCIAMDLQNKAEIGRMNIAKALVQGKMPSEAGEVLISEELAQKMAVSPGQPATMISSTMYGSMAISNFTVSGTVAFGVGAMDRGAVIMDMADAQLFLDMYDGTGEILGYFKDRKYNDKKAEIVAANFNAKFIDSKDRFKPVMLRLKEQDELFEMIDYMDSIKAIVMFVFLAVMSIVLWNAGLLGSIRRYGEIGVRLAIGEEKGHVYKTMILESLIIGVAGSFAGTLIGLGFAYILQIVGIPIFSAMKNASMMLPNTLRAQITPAAYYVGLFPGIAATVLGSSLAGIGIYKRNTSQLFKELEA